MGNVDFRVNPAGIAEICKSAGMRAELMTHAQKLANAANMSAAGHEQALHVTSFKKPPYAAHVDTLRHTAVGAAHTNGKMGQLDEARFKSLSRLNH